MIKYPFVIFNKFRLKEIWDFYLQLQFWVFEQKLCLSVSFHSLEFWLNEENDNNILVTHFTEFYEDNSILKLLNINSNEKDNYHKIH